MTCAIASADESSHRYFSDLRALRSLPDPDTSSGSFQITASSD